MNNLSTIRHKFVALQDLEKIAKQLKQSGKKIVFTNGCFDILHKGHVEYLAQAADKGDILVVGLNSDDSVRRQGKGEERPINKIEARQTILSALFFVDFVVEFDDETPINLIEKIKPDVLIKGGDYDPCETNVKSKTYIVGKDIVESYGGKVEVINLVEGFSTTKIVNQLKSGN
ncbi:MAG: D-glycero-beta-D-manno-heptose 1-phosphate adenylyltransferase [Putridiphycobacter sp.]